MALTLRNLKMTGRSAHGHDDINDSSPKRTPREITASYIQIYRDAIKQELNKAVRYRQEGQEILHHRSIQFAWNFRKAIHELKNKNAHLQQGVSSPEWWDEIQEVEF